MWSFIKQFFLHPKQVGSLLPSGPELVNLMVAPIDFKKAKHIVELGPGTGIITEKLLVNMRKDSTLTVIELNKDFCEHLKKHLPDSRLRIINGDAGQVDRHVKKADCLVSGLPLANFPPKEADTFLQKAREISKHYIQYNYSPMRETLYRKNFRTVTKKKALANIPPAIVYICRR